VIADLRRMCLNVNLEVATFFSLWATRKGPRILKVVDISMGVPSSRWVA
jgi:hypothetical protein